MANFYGMTRSNYFKVKNLEKFNEICKDFNLEIITDTDEDDKVGFIVNDESGIIMSGDEVNDNLLDDCEDENIDEITKYQIDKCGDELISELLEDDEVMIVQTIGNDIYKNSLSLGKSVTDCAY